MGVASYDMKTAFTEYGPAGKDGPVFFLGFRCGAVWRKHELL